MDRHIYFIYLGGVNMFFNWDLLDDIDIINHRFTWQGKTYAVKYFTVNGLIADLI